MPASSMREGRGECKNGAGPPYAASWRDRTWDMRRCGRQARASTQSQTFASINGPADWSSCFRRLLASRWDAAPCARVACTSTALTGRESPPAKRELVNFSSHTLIEPAVHLPPLAFSSRPAPTVPSVSCVDAHSCADPLDSALQMPSCWFITYLSKSMLGM